MDLTNGAMPIVLTAEDWNVVLGALAEAPYRVAAPVINRIQTQAQQQQQTRTAPPNKGAPPPRPRPEDAEAPPPPPSQF